MEDLSGRSFEPYRIVAPLGAGGMASVYKAYQPAVDRHVALKVLPRHLAQDREFLARFEQEAKILANLQHPHILPVHDYGESDGFTYIVMPFIKTGTLAAVMNGHPLPLEQIQRVVSQVGDALDCAHARGLVHRDVKPSNILLDERGNCLLADFGIAKILAGADTLTATGGLVGTPKYMSPEQGMGNAIDGRSDLYSLGVVLYEMAPGRVPFDAETPLAVVVKHIRDPLPLPSEVNPNIPDVLERMILRAMHKEPAERFGSAADMVARISAVETTDAGKTDGKTTVLIGGGRGRAHAALAPPARARVGDPDRALLDGPAAQHRIWIPIGSGRSRRPRRRQRSYASGHSRADNNGYGHHARIDPRHTRCAGTHPRASATCRPVGRGRRRGRRGRPPRSRRTACGQRRVPRRDGRYRTEADAGRGLGRRRRSVPGPGRRHPPRSTARSALDHDRQPEPRPGRAPVDRRKCALPGPRPGRQFHLAPLDATRARLRPPAARSDTISVGLTLWSAHRDFGDPNRLWVTNSPLYTPEWSSAMRDASARRLTPSGRLRHGRHPVTTRTLPRPMQTTTIDVS